MTTNKNPSPSKEREKLLQNLAEREAELAIISGVQDGLVAHLDVQEIFDLVGRRIRDFFDAQVVMISTYDPDNNSVEHRYAYECGEQIYYPGPHPPGGFRQKIIQTGKPVLVNTHVAEKAARLGQPTIPGTVTPKSWLGVPMFVEGQVTGILSLQNIEEENAFQKSHVRLLQTLAASMSVALENARLWEQENLYRRALEREFEIGREIQAGFLPVDLPRPKGWDIAASLQPAREVAGDFYDVYELPEELLGLVIGDVCDKGLGAALFMTLVRSLLRTVANMDFYARTNPGHYESPAERIRNAIHITNNYIVETHGDTGMFATIFFGILNPHTGVLTYINGGHQPPLLIHQGDVVRLVKTGPAVGVVPDVDYSIGEVVIGNGDLFFAYTDGLTDTANPDGETICEEDMIPILCGDQTLGSALNQIQKRVRSYSGGARQVDDITMLAIRRCRKSSGR